MQPKSSDFFRSIYSSVRFSSVGWRSIIGYLMLIFSTRIKGRQNRIPPMVTIVIPIRNETKAEQSIIGINSLQEIIQPKNIISPVIVSNISIAMQNYRSPAQLRGLLVNNHSEAVRGIARPFIVRSLIDEVVAQQRPGIDPNQGSKINVQNQGRKIAPRLISGCLLIKY